MALAELGSSITGALRRMRNATIIDEKALHECLKDITGALLHADVQYDIVQDMQARIKKIVNLDELAAGHDKTRIIHQAIFTELCKMLDPGKLSFTPKKNKTCVVMFVGLPGSGKTLTCIKYASHHKRRGWKPAVICADTRRAGGFEQLKQEAIKAKIPFYGSYKESDPEDGVEKFKKENFDLIIVDTSGRHKQVSDATKPDLVILVMDSSIGQAAFHQAQAFKQSVAVGAVIFTKMDGHAKGGGALSAVAATKSPIIFIGTGGHIDDFEVFDAKPFVSRLLGIGDYSGFLDTIYEIVPADEQPGLLQKLSEGTSTLRNFHFGQVLSALLGLKRYMTNSEWIARGSGVSMEQDEESMEQDECPVWSSFLDKIHEVVPADERLKLLQKLSEGTFTLRIMCEQFENILNMGPFGQVFSMYETEIRAKVKRYITIMDSMTTEELDNTNSELISEPRILRIARGSGCQVREVKEMFEDYTRLATTCDIEPSLFRDCDATVRNMQGRTEILAVNVHVDSNTNVDYDENDEEEAPRLRN